MLLQSVFARLQTAISLKNHCIKRKCKVHRRPVRRLFSDGYRLRSLCINSRNIRKNKGYQFVSIDSCPHESTHDEVTKAATCTEKGSKNTVCDKCGAITSTTEIPALGHNFVVNDTVDNHLIDGHIYTSYKCSREGCTETKETIEHYRLTNGETKYLWCNGFYEHTNTATCQKLELKLSNVLSKAVMLLKAIFLKNRSQHSGLRDCYACNLYDRRQEKGSLLGLQPGCRGNHSCNRSSIQQCRRLSRSCKKIDNTAEDGHIHEIYACRACGEQIDVPVHVAWVDGAYTSNTITEVTCRVDGMRVDSCTICNEKRTVIIPSNGEHKYVATGNSTAATCTTRGFVEYKCSVCGRIKKSIPMPSVTIM